MRNSFELFVGVDIAAKTFAASWAAEPSKAPRAVTFPQTPEGFAAFHQRLAATGVAPASTLITLEATASYWPALAVWLHQAAYHVSVLNPAQVAQYARSLPRRAKTDNLDAQLLLQLAFERRLPAWSPPEQVYHELRQRLVVRDGLQHMLTQAKNQRHAVEQWPVRVASAISTLDTVIAELEQQLRGLERELKQVLTDGAWAASAALLLSAPGFGLVTTAWLLVGTMNFSLAQSAEQLTAYVGLAPMVRESGTSVRGRAEIGHGGNGRVRTALYMASLSAAQHNPSLRAFYERLRAAGKPAKVARCAAARKLLHLAWAMVKKQRPYQREGVGEGEKQTA